MTRAAVVLALLLSLLLPSSCMPLPVSAECRPRISDCLKGCQGAGGPPPIGEERSHGWDGTDIRSSCERHCHSLCN